MTATSSPRSGTRRGDQVSKIPNTVITGGRHAHLRRAQEHVSSKLAARWYSVTARRRQGSRCRD
jgi:hypothetical protein